MRLLHLLAIPLFTASAGGCSMCCSPHDLDYVAYGSIVSRADPQHGRVGSPFSDVAYGGGAYADNEGQWLEPATEHQAAEEVAAEEEAAESEAEDQRDSLPPDEDRDPPAVIESTPLSRNVRPAPGEVVPARGPSSDPIEFDDASEPVQVLRWQD